MKKQSAFTLLELLITISLLMILIFLANQNYSRLFSRHALVTSAETLSQYLQLAKSQSIKFNKKVYAHFCQQSGTQAWKVSLSEEGHCDCFVENSCQLNGQQYSTIFSDGKWVTTTQSDITFTGEQASYNPMRFSVNAGSITLTSRDGEKLKVIQSSLRLRVCSPFGEVSGYPVC